MYPLTQLGPRGVQFNSTPAGVCERHDEHTRHLTAVQMLTDVDGQSFIDDASLTVITIQDVAGAIVETAPAVDRLPVPTHRGRVKLRQRGHLPIVRER
jgi:hypothetical protein